MNRTIKAAGGLVLASAVAIAATAKADPDEDELVIEGEKIITTIEAPADSPFDTLYSGWHFRSDETQALQADDFENPAFVAVDHALDQFETVDGTEGKSCASCHEGGAEEFAGLRAGLPRWNADTGKPETLEKHHQRMPHRTDGRRSLEVGSAGNGRHDRFDRPAVARRAGEGADRRRDDALVREGQGALLYAGRPAGHGLLELPRRQLRHDDPRRSSQPGPNQRLSRLPG